MPRIRVLLTEMPRLLVDFVTGIVAEQDDIEIADASGDDASLIRNAELTDADLVIVAGRRGRKTSLYTEFLLHRPRSKLLSIVDDGRRGILFELRPFQVRLGELSPEVMLDAIRSTRAQPARGELGQ